MNRDPKKVLVTGVAGFLGSNLLSKLLQEGHQVVGIANLSMGKLDDMQLNLKKIWGSVPGMLLRLKPFMLPINHKHNY